MKKPIKIIFTTINSEEIVKEYVIMSSGDYVVRTEDESYWFDKNGKHPKSYLIFQ